MANKNAGYGASTGVVSLIGGGFLGSNINPEYGAILGDAVTPPTPIKISRYFRSNLGTIDYAKLESAITLIGDFELSGVFYVPFTTDTQWIISDWNDDASAKSWGIRIRNGFIQVFTSSDGVTTISGPSAAVLPNLLTPFLLRKVGNTAFISVNGGTEVSGNAAAVVFNSGLPPALYAKPGGSDILLGIIANLEISSEGALIHSWKIDDNDNTLIDSVGGNNATLVNPLASDWGLFTEQKSGSWIGQSIAPDYADVSNWNSVSVDITSEDGVLSISNVSGGSDRGEFNVPLARVGSTYNVKIGARRVSGNPLFNLWVGWSIPATFIIDDALYNFDNLITSSSAKIRAYPSSVGELEIYSLLVEEVLEIA